MSTSGFPQHGHAELSRRPWQAPCLSVLVFRATAQSPPPPPPSPPPPPPVIPPTGSLLPPPPPPPPKKGDFSCDAGAFVGVGTGQDAGTPVTKAAQKHPDTHLAGPCLLASLS